MRTAHRAHSIFRAAALTILLSGLLFSNGEGIRLLPFPAADRSAYGSINLEAGLDADYHENITRFEKRQSAFGFQKHNKQAMADPAGSGYIESTYRPVAITLNAVSIYGEDFVIAGRVFVSDLNCRPPPYA